MVEGVALGACREMADLLSARPEQEQVKDVKNNPKIYLKNYKFNFEYFFNLFSGTSVSSGQQTWPSLASGGRRSGRVLATKSGPSASEHAADCGARDGSAHVQVQLENYFEKIILKLFLTLIFRNS